MIRFARPQLTGAPPLLSWAVRRHSPPHMPDIIEFETERLRLVAWQEKHVAPFAAMNADPEVMRYFPAMATEAQTRATVTAWRGQFEEQGWSNWAVEIKSSGEFIGFIGLSVPRRQLPFSPCVEVGWRLARRFWGKGYATEGAKATLAVGFGPIGLAEIVSFTSLTNSPSRAVMERIGMHNADRDFDHPAVPEGSPLRRHCLYVISHEQWRRGDASSFARGTLTGAPLSSNVRPREHGMTTLPEPNLAPPGAGVKDTTSARTGWQLISGSVRSRNRSRTHP